MELFGSSPGAPSTGAPSTVTQAPSTGAPLTVPSSAGAPSTVTQAPVNTMPNLTKLLGMTSVMSAHNDLFLLLTAFKTDKTKKTELLSLLNRKIDTLKEAKNTEKVTLLELVKKEVEDVKIGGYKKKSRGKKSRRMRKRMSRRGGTYKKPENM
jgi:hypothetical protein